MSPDLTRLARKRPRSSDDSVLPLINVVFLLLIFFMLTGKLAVSDPFEVAPPESGSEGPSGSRDMIVLVGREGQVALDGRVLSEAEFGAAVAERLEENQPFQIQLKADQLAEATLVVRVMEMMREAGIERVQLLTIPERR